MAGIPGEGTTLKNFPHKKEEIKLQHITAKLKAVRVKYRQAVDSGQRSDHRRVVMMYLLYYELCEALWGGSPSTGQIVGGIETTELPEASQIFSDSLASTPCTTSTVQSQPVDFQDSDAESEDVQMMRNWPSSYSEKWREFLDSELKNHKQNKIKQKLPMDAQILGCAQEELTMKK